MAAYVDTPSIPITLDREYSLSWPGRRLDRWLDDRLFGAAADASRPPIDLVHIQADFWGAFTGHRFAARHRLPVVQTMHNRVDVGIRETLPFPALALRAFIAWERRALGDTTPGDDGWSYLRRLAARSKAVTAPSAHFAERLEANGVFPRVDVIWNGVDDDALDATLADAPARRPAGPPRFVWLGRMSPEKRLLPFLDAIADSGVRAEVEVIGRGGQLAAARRLVEQRHPAASVRFSGRLHYRQTLARIQAADALVQTSIGFETQGMTPFEAASLGTPAIISDPDIARELGSGFWAVGGGVDAPAAQADASTEALAATLREAAADIAAGTAPTPDPTIRERFRQSSRTAAMVEVYRRVL